MNENVLMGLFAGLGALLYNVWGFAEAYKASLETPEVEKFSWIISLTTVVPSLVLGFLAGYATSGGGVVDFIGLITSGFGVAAAQGKLGINKFFA